MSTQARGLEFWRARLREVRLPILSGADALSILTAPEVDLQSLGRVLDADLPLALDVIAYASTQTRGSHEILGLQHALGMLGVAQVQQRLKLRLDPSFDPTRPGHSLCVQALASSRLAVQLLWSWTRRLHPTKYDEHLDWVTLLLGMARWKLPLAAPDIALQIETRVAQGERRSVVEKSLLGCSIEALNIAHLHDIGLPPDKDLQQATRLNERVIAKAWRHARHDGLAPELPPELARPLRQRTAICMLAHLLAWSVRDDWYSLRSQRLLALASTLAGLPLDTVIAGSRGAALRVSHAPEFRNRITAPAAQLLWPPKPRRSLRPATPVSRPYASPPGMPGTRMTRRRPAQPDTAVVNTFAQNCLHGRHTDLRQFIDATSQALESGLGLARCMLFLKATGTEQLGCYFAHGFNPAFEARTLMIPAADDNLLARLFRHASGSLWIKASQVDGARQQLPSELRQYTQASGVMLAAVNLNQRPVGVVWADSGPDGHPLGEGHYDEFRHMFQHFGAEFSRLTQALKRR